MRQMHRTVAMENKLTLGAMCFKSSQEDTKCAFQWGWGQSMQHFREGGNYLKVWRSKCVAALSPMDNEELQRIWLKFVAFIRAVYSDHWKMWCNSLFAFFFLANRNVFILKFVRKMAFSYNNWGYFPFPPPVLICFSCPSLHFQRKMNNSVRGLAQ